MFCKTVDVPFVPSTAQNITLTMTDHRHQYHHTCSVRVMKSQLKPIHYSPWHVFKWVGKLTFAFLMWQIPIVVMHSKLSSHREHINVYKHLRTWHQTWRLKERMSPFIACFLLFVGMRSAETPALGSQVVKYYLWQLCPRCWMLA